MDQVRQVGCGAVFCISLYLLAIDIGRNVVSCIILDLAGQYSLNNGLTDYRATGVTDK